MYILYVTHRAAQIVTGWHRIVGVIDDESMRGIVRLKYGKPDRGP